MMMREESFRIITKMINRTKVFIYSIVSAMFTGYLLS